MGSRSVRLALALLAVAGCASAGHGAPVPEGPPAKASGAKQPGEGVPKKRWLFVWRDMGDPKEVDRVLSRFPRAKAAGYNGIVLSANVPPAKASEVRDAARRNSLDIIAVVMGNNRDRNYVEGVLAKDALFIRKGQTAAFQPDNPTRVVNGDFEDAAGNRMKGWGFQDDEGITTFADHEVTHGGRTSLRMESISKNEHQHCRISQPIKLQPHRQYRISFWLKTEGLTPANPEVKVLTADAQGAVCWQTFHTDATQDWKHYDLAFNSLGVSDARIYLGTWYGKSGRMWWDDLAVEEIGLVNVLRRPGCPVTVRSDSGTPYEEGRDYERIADPQLHPYIAYHTPPTVRLTAGTRIPEGERLRISYYHPIIIYEDRLTSCVSEPKIFDDWRAEVKRADELLHPAGFLMSHDEMRVMNQCALCQSKRMTPGELLAWNVKQAAQIIHDARPDAEVWVWNDMFDPMHNATDHFYAVNGPLAGSWKGLDKSIGIVNWHGGLVGKNCRFFADLGLRQVLAGYYDGDEDGAAIAKWQAATQGIPGIEGAMYTTWEDKYDAMDRWAARAWGKPTRP